LTGKYPTSHNGGGGGIPMAEKFEEILRFHIPPSPDKTILDPTCGKRYLWESLFNGLNEKSNQLDLDGNPIKLPWKVIFSDIQDFGYNKVCDVKDLTVEAPVDGIVYDPPYFFGTEKPSTNFREYGDYSQTYEDLLEFMDVANEKFPALLKEDGKLILRCSDMIHYKQNKFYPLHITWANRLSNWEMVDFIVLVHKWMGWTDFMVKDRSCSVGMHSYLMVFKKKGAPL
jgi:hypothetical protein